MVSRKVVLTNEKGLHLRPAGRVCDLALTFSAKSEMHLGNGIYNLKSMLSVLSAQVTPGTEMEIVCDGPDEDEALDAICTLLNGDLESGS